MDQIIPQMRVEMQQEVVLPGHKKGQEGFLEAVGTEERLEERMQRTGVGKTLNPEGHPRRAVSGRVGPWVDALFSLLSL